MGNQGKHPMQRTEKNAKDIFVEGIVIDICTRSFLLLSDMGDKKFVECDTVDEFMSVLDVVTQNLNEDQIEYAELAVTGS